MPGTVLDYSAGEPGAKAIKQAGHLGAIRYIGFPARTKCTSREELDDFTRHELGMALVYEDHDRDWQSGRGGGQAAARRARAHADEIGFPADRPIYMAVDRDVVTAADFDVMSAYLAGAADVLGVGRTGVYGEHDVCVRAAADRVASWFWQCRAWSGTPVKYFAGRHLFQRVGTVRVGGIGCDINDVLRDDWGQHTITANQEEDMQLGDQFKDWAGNTQSVESWMNNVDERLARLFHAFTVADQKSRIPGDENLTNWGDGILDTVARVSMMLGQVQAIAAQLGNLQAGIVDVPALAAALKDNLAPEIAKALGEKLVA